MLPLGNHGCVLWFKLPSLSESNLHLCSPLGTITLYSGVGEGEEDGRSGKNVRSPLFPFTAALSRSSVERAGQSLSPRPSPPPFLSDQMLTAQKRARETDVGSDGDDAKFRVKLLNIPRNGVRQCTESFCPKGIYQ